ncbi:MAG: Asp-tRNA(Asn)/Glu-tRNA(Gln) amidotransferase subunit GatC [Planctomycetes bacterium]|nr:Asp-tRNA(Asn)/Glu-tRNA(Gln) amidotransferase subunit GatC [Planctomycetota bacterium]
MELTQELLRKIATLSRLEIAEEDEPLIIEKFRQVLGYVEKVNQLDFTGVEPTVYAVDTKSVMREDSLREPLPRAEVLANAPSRDEAFFLVPKVLD